MNPNNHQTTKPLTLLTVALALTAVMGMGSSAHAIEWSDRIRATWFNQEGRVPNDGISVWSAGISIGPDGRKHIFYMSDKDTTEDDNILYQTILDSTGTVIDSSIKYCPTGRVDIMGDAEGNVHCIYKTRSSVNYFKTDPDGNILIDYMQIFGEGASWPSQYSRVMDVDNEGNAWTFYGGTRRSFLYRINENGEVTRWEVANNQEPILPVTTCIAVGPDGNIHLAGVGYIFLGHWIGYMRISPEGEVLVDVTALSPLERDHSYWPDRMKVGDNGDIHLQASISHDSLNASPYAIGYWRFTEDLDTLAIVRVDRRLSPYGGGFELLDDDRAIIIWQSTQRDTVVDYPIRYAVIEDNEIVEGPQVLIPRYASISNSAVAIYNDRIFLATSEDLNSNAVHNSNDLFYYTSPPLENNSVNYSLNPINEFEVKAYPIPFNETLHLNFNLPYPAYITCEITDIQGRKVGSIWDGFMYAGMNRLAWNPSAENKGFPAGKYLLVLRNGNSVTVVNTVLVK